MMLHECPPLFFHCYVLHKNELKLRSNSPAVCLQKSDFFLKIKKILLFLLCNQKKNQRRILDHLWRQQSGLKHDQRASVNLMCVCSEFGPEKLNHIRNIHDFESTLEVILDFQPLKTNPKLFFSLSPSGITCFLSLDMLLDCWGEFSRRRSILSRADEEAVLERILRGFLCVSCTYRDYSHKPKFQLVNFWYVSEPWPLALSWKL